MFPSQISLLIIIGTIITESCKKDCLSAQTGNLCPDTSRIYVVHKNTLEIILKTVLKKVFQPMIESHSDFNRILFDNVEIGRNEKFDSREFLNK